MLIPIVRPRYKPQAHSRRTQRNPRTVGDRARCRQPDFPCPASPETAEATATSVTGALQGARRGGAAAAPSARLHSRSHDDRHGPVPRRARRGHGDPPNLQRIQPSGIVHLGNDLGAIRNYVALQDQYEAIYCIVDYHALTSLHDPNGPPQTREMAASPFALGLDMTKCTLFVHSHRPEHTQLAWLFATVTPVSWVERTPTYKEKREQHPTTSITACSPTPSCRPPTSSSTTRTAFRSARTRRRTSS